VERTRLKQSHAYVTQTHNGMLVTNCDGMRGKRKGGTADDGVNADDGIDEKKRISFFLLHRQYFVGLANAPHMELGSIATHIA
jgi:hypothetical protein